MTTKPLRFAMAYMIDARAALLFSVQHLKEGSGESSNGLRLNPKKSLYMTLGVRLCLRCARNVRAPPSLRFEDRDYCYIGRFLAAHLWELADEHSPTTAAPRETRQFLPRLLSPAFQWKGLADKDSSFAPGSLRFLQGVHT